MPPSGDVGRTGSSRRALMAASLGDPENLGWFVDGHSDPQLWVEMERLPTPERARRGVLLEVDGQDKLVANQIDIRHLTPPERQLLLERILQEVEEDNQRFLGMIRNRYHRVGLELPKIEVRFENLTVEGDLYVGSRALPTLLNATMNVVEEMAELVGIFPSKKKVHKILHGVSGIVKPSRMTLLLGPPSSGKTTLLRSLSGMLDKKLRMSGRITYCGRDLSEFVPQRTSSYVSQHDVHTSEMTVREILNFSQQCSGVGSRYELLIELLKREKEAGVKPDPDIDAFTKAIALEGQKTNLITDYILKVLGLDVCADTIVGNEMRRGISGGQKKRVTTGEMLTGPKRALFMDDISTGLDSSTTFQIVKFIRQMIHVVDGTAIISLLQPAPEVFDLFDDIILLSEGHVAYHGPREHVLEFFEIMGFRCPERKGIADFLQEVTSKKDQEKYWFNEIQQFRHISALEFADSFKTFHVGQQITESLGLPHDASQLHCLSSLTRKKYGISSWELFKANFSREWLLIKRNSFVYLSKIVQITTMSLIAMSVFFRAQMRHKTIADGAKYLDALFYGLLIILFNGLAEIPMTVERLPVFYKQRDFLFYPPWAFGLPYVVLRIPLSLLESGIWMALTYYLIGFAPAATRFFRQFLAFFLTHLMSFSLCRFMAATGRTMITANTYATFFFLVLFVLGGFIISKDDVRPWWKWASWVSPVMYGQNAIAITEFLDPRWSTPNDDTSINEPTVGKAILKSRGMFLDDHWYWISVVAIAGFALLFNACFILALSYLNPPASFHAVPANEEADSKIVEDSIARGKPMLKETKRSAETSANISGQMHGRGMVLPFQPLALTFSHVNYYVDVPKETKSRGSKGNRLQLLCDVSGALRPGVLTALVGVSGAGKTTLMDVLAGRKTKGYIEGNIEVSGYPKNQATFARVSGYCEQNDIHSPYVTVYESLLYSAWLRLPPEIKQETRKAFVEEVMELIELNLLRNAMVGSPGVDGLSTEQRKRLTIAVELVSNPSIIFMDEPTSGLDARSAAIVMRTVRNTVDTGRTVVCTIHQPSIDIFESFDELLLMKIGGRLIYAGPLGPRSSNLIEYFEAIPGVPKIRTGYNPAAWVLEISSPSLEAQLKVDFGQIYSSSSLYKRNEELINELSVPALGSKDISFPTKYSQSFGSQSVACLWKQRQSYWRNPNYNCTRFFMTLAFGLLFGTMFWEKGAKISKEQDLFNLLGGIYVAVFFLGSTIATLVQPIIVAERTVFYRERAAGMYSPLSYAFAQVGIEIVYIAALSLLYALLLFSLMGYGWRADKFFWFLYFVFMCLICFALFSMMTAALTPNLATASVLTSFFFCFWNLFSGFIVPRSLTPIWWRWFYWVCPVFWSIYGVVMSQVGDMGNEVEIPGRSNVTVKALLKERLGFEQGFLGYVAVVLAGYVLLFFFVFVCCVKFLNYQNR